MRMTKRLKPHNIWDQDTSLCRHLTQHADVALRCVRPGRVGRFYGNVGCIGPTSSSFHLSSALPHVLLLNCTPDLARLRLTDSPVYSSPTLKNVHKYALIRYCLLNPDDFSRQNKIHPHLSTQVS